MIMVLMLVNVMDFIKGGDMKCSKDVEVEGEVFVVVVGACRVVGVEGFVGEVFVRFASVIGTN